jgi:hypothetical protein
VAGACLKARGEHPKVHGQHSKTEECSNHHRLPTLHQLPSHCLSQYWGVSHTHRCVHSRLEHSIPKSQPAVVPPAKHEQLTPLPAQHRAVHQAAADPDYGWAGMGGATPSRCYITVLTQDGETAWGGNAGDVGG